MEEKPTFTMEELESLRLSSQKAPYKNALEFILVSIPLIYYAVKDPSYFSIIVSISVVLLLSFAWFRNYQVYKQVVKIYTISIEEKKK